MARHRRPHRPLRLRCRQQPQGPGRGLDRALPNLSPYSESASPIPSRGVRLSCPHPGAHYFTPEQDMNPEITLQWLREACPGLRQQFALAHLGVIGSVARGTAGPNSDVNILVEFEGPATLDDFMGLKAELEQLLICLLYT